MKSTYIPTICHAGQRADHKLGGVCMSGLPYGSPSSRYVLTTRPTKIKIILNMAASGNDFFRRRLARNLINRKTALERGTREQSELLDTFMQNNHIACGP